MNFFHNIIDNYKHLLDEFTGITLNPQGILDFVINILITLVIVLIFYLFGGKLRRFFFKENNKLTFFVDTALGYTAIGTGIAILGFFSFFQTENLYLYLIIASLIALYPFKLPNKNIFIQFWINFKKQFKSKEKFIILGVLLFVSLSFLRLSIPEIEEDTYHTDLPYFYLSSQTTMLESRDHLHVIPFPQLAEMTYVIPVLFGQKDAARFIHYAFYLLIILLLFKFSISKKNMFAKFSPLLFVTAPVVMRYSHSQYIDFFMVFTFLLSMLLIQKSSSRKGIILSGIIFGAVISTKMWILVYFPAVLIYIVIINKNLKVINILKLLFVFYISSLAVAVVWYIRAYIITGYPIYPLFAQITDFESNRVLQASSAVNYFGFNWRMFTYPNMIVLSPLFFLGIIYSLINFKNLITMLKKSALIIFIIAMSLEQLIIKVDFGRYLFAWYTFAIIIISAGLRIALDKSKIAKYLFVSIYVLIFGYYSLSSLLTLPYGFAWADQNKYLSRIMERNNASYYDFDHLFNKLISDKDLVAIYGLSYYYYADFKYIDARYVFNKTNRSFDSLKAKKITKLLVKDGDIRYFCKKLQLENCKPEKARLLVSYSPTSTKVYNLYSLNW